MEFFSGRPLKYPKRSDRDRELNFRWELIILEEILKVFLHPSPPLERESFVKVCTPTNTQIESFVNAKMRL